MDRGAERQRSGGASSRRGVRCGTRAAVRHRLVQVLVPCGVALAACVPERALSSYREPRDAPTETTRNSVRSLPDAGSAPDPGPDDAGADAAVTIAAPASGDAGPAAPATLICREECACESGVFGPLMFCPTPVSHDDAVERCALAGGSLASVDDAERNAWLSERMAALDADDFWLSGTDGEQEGIWRWVDGRVFFDADAEVDAGTPRPYAPWDEEQPNDLNGEDCMRSTGGVWRDLDCTEAIAYVCEG